MVCRKKTIWIDTISKENQPWHAVFGYAWVSARPDTPCSVTPEFQRDL